jgi:hypothetical protein
MRTQDQWFGGDVDPSFLQPGTLGINVELLKIELGRIGVNRTGSVRKMIAGGMCISVIVDDI